MEILSTSPESTPEGRLIHRTRVLTIPKLSIRAAAERIGMSAEQWGYIERGYRPAGAGNPPRQFSPPAGTLARMARSLGISAQSLAAEGQRPDAAALLEGAAMTETYDVYGKLEDPMGVLGVALAQWETRDDTKPQPEVRQAANTAIDAIDAMLRGLYLMRGRLVGEIRISDEATAARADALLEHRRQAAAQVTEAGDG